MSDPLADLLRIPAQGFDPDTGEDFIRRRTSYESADAIRSALADGSLSLGDLGATQTLPECTCPAPVRGFGPIPVLHEPTCAIEQTEWWRIPEGGER